MYRRAFSYDDALEDPSPMTPPPSDMGSIPWKPVIPERKYQHLAKVSNPAGRLCPACPSGWLTPQLWVAATPGCVSGPLLQLVYLFYSQLQQLCHFPPRTVLSPPRSRMPRGEVPVPGWALSATASTGIQPCGLPGFLVLSTAADTAPGAWPACSPHPALTAPPAAAFAHLGRPVFCSDPPGVKACLTLHPPS